MKIFSYLLVLVSFSLLSDARAQDLEPVLQRLYGQDLFHPSAGSALANYLKESSAQTVMRKFPKAPKTNPDTPVDLGVDKLVVAVSPETFPLFIKYFSPKNYLYAISLYRNWEMQVAHQGKTSLYSPPMRDQLSYVKEGVLMVPFVMDDKEAERASTFMEVVNKFGQNWSNRDGIFYPQNITTLSGQKFFPKSMFWDSCAAWFGNMPIGENLTDTYYFPSGNEVAVAQKLEDFKISDADSDQALHRIWQVPGHQQLGDIVDRKAIARGDFSNGGWILYTLMGSVGVNRVPVVFLQVDDEKKPIDPNFPLQFDVQFAGRKSN